MKHDSDAHQFVNELKEIHPQNKINSMVIAFLVGNTNFKFIQLLGLCAVVNFNV